MHYTTQRKNRNNKQINVWWRPLRSGLLYLKEFSETTTLHGIRHIGLSNRHFMEILLWVLCVILAIYGSYKVMHDSWIRYNTNPTVITVQKDYRYWYLQFPSSTFCYVNPVDINFAKDYVQRKWKVNSGKKFDYYMDFVKKIGNITYESLDNLAPFVNDSKLINVDIIDLILKVHAKLRYKTTIFSNDYANITFQPVLTEMGICYTFSGVITNYLTPNSELQNINSNSPTPSCNFLNSLCYVKTEEIPRSILYYVHYPKEVPNIVDKYYTVQDNFERDTAFTFLEMTSALELRRLSPSQRRCRFMDEPMDDTIPVYSYNVCRMICRRNLALKMCKCTPHFYPYPGEMKVCNIKGLYCLSNHSKMLMTLEKNDGTPIECNCQMQCEDVKLFVDEDTAREWTNPVKWDIGYRWAIVKYSKTRLRRDVIYSFEDLLVSLGGTASFFLGCSVLSFVEIGYYLTLRLYWFANRKHKD
ncbi:acid-sensing ion channel 4-A-like [Melanaphis sacchari]|uniref:acid-sensing ion channel 4-A-like n=1 Tax=Melanaphis sacchari TaxID=742174 RepID=UPI000DC14402|nr:acid-sensing ion channel 4-A-like [Melanaphis sacchari]